MADRFFSDHVGQQVAKTSGHVCDVDNGVRTSSASEAAFSHQLASDVTMAMTGDSFLSFPSAEQSINPSSANLSESDSPDRKRQRDRVEQMVEGGGHRFGFTTMTYEPEMSATSSSSSAHQEHYQQQDLMDDSDYSSDNDTEGLRSEGTSKKSKRAKPQSYRAEASNSESEIIRRNQTPACRYDLVRVALLRFREIYGNTSVKRGFIVPLGSADWPEETWGIRLDLAVRKIREGTTYADHMDDLRSLGFAFETRRAGYGFNMLRDGVLKYREIHGDMNITRAFIVPKDNPLWPPNMWGVHLGSCLRDIKRGKCYADRKEELRAIGYNFLINGRSTGKKYDFARIKSAFSTYKEVYGDLLVQAKYVVPLGDDAWPKETWGIKLGTYTQLIRMGKYGEDKRTELIELGFLFDNQRAKYGFELVRCALMRYKEIYGNFLVKQKFLVPSGDVAAAAQWPERTWGIKLGNVLHDIRQGDSYRNKKEELEQLGITYYTHKQPRGRQAQGQGQTPELLPTASFQNWSEGNRRVEHTPFPNYPIEGGGDCPPNLSPDPLISPCPEISPSPPDCSSLLFEGDSSLV